MINILYQSNRSALTQGGQKSLWFLLRDLDRNAYLPVLTCQDEGELTRCARERAIPCEIVPLPPLHIRHLGRILKTIFRYRAIIKKHRIRIIHAEELVAVMLFRIATLGIATTLIWHVRVSFNKPRHLRIGLRLADIIVCVSHAVKASFPDSPKVRVVQNGINPDEYVPGHNRLVTDRIAPQARCIGYIGSLDENKGTDLLIDAAPGIVAAFPGIQFVIVGSGSPAYTERLVAKVRTSGVGGNVLFWGREDGDTVPLMNRFDIFTLTSYSEGLSRSILEAMCLEKPIVASNIAANREVITDGKTGLLFACGDARDLEEKIIALLRDPALGAALAREARLHVCAHFTHSITIEAMHALYAGVTRHD